jgi:glycosyltransferase involved in cell wall biosynthesis
LIPVPPVARRPHLAVFDLVTSVGGVQQVMALLLPRLAERVEVSVLDPYRNPDYARLLAGRGVTQVVLGGAPRRRFVGGAGRTGRALALARRAPWLLATGLRLRRWARARRPDVIWFNQLPSASLFPSFLPAGGPAIVYQAHGFGSAAELRGGPRLGRRCARVVAVSGAVARLLGDAGVDPARIAVVPNGVDADEVVRRARALALPLPPRAPGQVVLVHPAVLGPHKRQHVAVEALARLPPAAVLWLCGSTAPGADPAYEAGLRALAARLGVAERVAFLGWRPDLPAVLAAADVAVLPSRMESFGLVLAEAMALGKPCVGAAVGGIPEVIAHGVTGLVAAGEPAAFAAALAPLVRSAEVRGVMGEAGRRRVRERFGADRQARAVADLLDEVIARGAATAATAPAPGPAAPASPSTPA